MVNNKSSVKMSIFPMYEARVYKSVLLLEARNMINLSEPPHCLVHRVIQTSKCDPVYRMTSVY